MIAASVMMGMLPVASVSADVFLFTKNLGRGVSGEEVRRLQEVLKSIPDVYSGGVVTGYFGLLTEAAVKKLQIKYGIESVGSVGPKTRSKLNLLLLSVASPQTSGTQSSIQLRDCPSSTATGCQKTAQQIKAFQSGIFDPSHGTCQGKGSVQFGASPFRIDQLEIIEPMGLTVGGHVTPIDHGYMFGKGTPNVSFDAFDIQSPAKGYVVEISRTQRGNMSDYALTIEFSCTHYVHYSNMSSFAPKLMAAAGGSVGENETKPMRVAVKEGELVGRTGPYGIDLYVWDFDKTLTGFVNPKSYGGESWKLHSAQLYDYVKEPLRTQLLAKTPRQAEPRFGKIDYDIDGRLVGNWFQEGTNGYAGLNHGGEGYWSGHLSIAYDALDPTGIIVSIGNWTGGAQQFGVRGNAPDPKDVSVAMGLVKYELLQPDWVVTATGERWDRREYVKEVTFKPIDNVPNAVKGVILLQLVELGKLKVELFPGKTADQVSGFTSAALIYGR